MSRFCQSIVLVFMIALPGGGCGQEPHLPPSVRQLVDAALERTDHHVIYDGSYRSIGYPGGDVPDSIGVCTDVVIRSYRALDIDLQKLVHEDMTLAFEEYPRTWGLDHPDPNIDHRRVPNLQTYLARQGTELPVSSDPGDYRPGDLVTWLIPGNLPHIGIVVDRWSQEGRRPLVVHNIGAGPVLEDALFAFEVTGRYRYLPSQRCAPRTPTTAQESPTAGNRASNFPRYEDILEDIQRGKRALFSEYEDAGTEAARKEVLQQAGEYFTGAVMGKIAPFWLGTPWDFNGTTEVPGEGRIACGYFVTTVLRDAGVVLDRVGLAQQPSEIMIRRLVGSAAIKRYRDVPIEEFVAAIREWGRGLYVVGLDIHVGIIVHDEAGVRFVHSSYLPPACVLQEEATESVILAGSRYRVLGKLTADRHFLETWLNGSSVTSGGG